jgi:hypothetical protein
MKWGLLLVVVLTAVLLVPAGAGRAGASSGPTLPTGIRSAVIRIRSAAAAQLRSGAARTVQSITEPALTVHDPTGDEFGMPRTAVDITAAGFHGGSAHVTFAVRVVVPVDPTTNASWVRGDSAISWFVDANFDGSPDAYALLLNDGSGGLLVGVLSKAMDDICFGDGEWLANHDYAISLPIGCLKGMPQFQWGVVTEYLPDDAHFSGDGAPNSGFVGPVKRTEGAPLSGYWMLGGDGAVYPFGASFSFKKKTAFAVSIAPRRDGTGYWVTDLVGHVNPFGRTKRYGSLPVLNGGEIVTAISATKTGRGYWLFSSAGRVFTYGDAQFHGDLRNKTLNGPIIATAVTASGNGYYMVGLDGGIFTFGDARFRGSMGGKHLNAPIIGIATDPDNDGYWLVGTDGGVFAFHAPFRGSLGGKTLNSPVNGMVAFGNGYLMVAGDGGVFNFSNKKFLGSLGGHALAAPINDIAAFTS